MPRARHRELLGPVVQRPLARPITALFVARRIEPLVATLLGLVCCLVAAVLFAVDPGPFGSIAAGAFVLLGSVLDCVDGAAADARGMVTPVRRWLDTLADRISDAAIVLGITIGFAADSSDAWPWIAGFVSAAFMMLTSYSRKEYELTSGQPYRATFLDALGRRDVRTIGFFLGGVTMAPFVLVVVLGAISALAFVAGVVRHATRLDG